MEPAATTSDSVASAPACPAAAQLMLRTAGHDFQVFVESGPLVESMLRDMATARQRLWLESYIYADDAAGRAVAAALAERARAGVDVRLMIDAVGSYALPESLLSELRAAGVAVHVFNPFRQALRKWQRFFTIFNRRNHRKLLVIDDQLAYFGGMNVVDQTGLTTADSVAERGLPASSGWRDSHLRMQGPQQREIAQSMDRLWQRVVNRRRVSWPRWPIKQMFAEDEGIYFFDSFPRLRLRRPHRVFRAWIRSARQSVVLAMAYFLPHGSVLRELIRARRRGVRVSVIVPDRSDVPLVRWASRYVCDRLVRQGIRIHERQDRMLHGKVMVIDDYTTIIGSCNLDPRSFRLNLEFLAVIRSRAMASAMLEVCRYELAHSRRVTRGEVRRRSCWDRVRDRLAWSLRWWL